MKIISFISLLVFSFILGTGMAGILAGIAHWHDPTDFLFMNVAMYSFFGGCISAFFFPFLYYKKFDKVLSDKFLLTNFCIVSASGLLSYCLSFFNLGWIGLATAALIYIGILLYPESD